MDAISLAEIVERCNAILGGLTNGKQPDSNEFKFLMSCDIVARNFKSPDDGPIGNFCSIMMQNINKKQCLISAEKCELKPGETVLEVGTGGHGLAMEVLLKTAGLSKLVGIEISDTLRSQVCQHFCEEIEKNQLIMYGTDCKDMAHIFPENDSVDCILAINVVYFLDPLPDYLQEFHRVLKPSTGRVIFSCKENVKKSDKENDSSIFKNMDFDRIVIESKRMGFEVDVEEVKFEENSFIDNFTLIKLHKY